MGLERKDGTAWLTENHSGAGILGPMAKLVKVRSGYEAAVAAVLGDWPADPPAPQPAPAGQSPSTSAARPPSACLSAPSAERAAPSPSAADALAADGLGAATAAS
ncbi:hypothetical protein MAHJHV28_42370 [Mycobacterium avium subsp. hominissuis]